MRGDLLQRAFPLSPRRCLIFSAAGGYGKDASGTKKVSHGALARSTMSIPASRAFQKGDRIMATDTRRTAKARAANAMKRPEPGNDALFRLLVESVSDYAIISLDAKGIVTTWNTGAERVA